MVCYDIKKGTFYEKTIHLYFTNLIGQMNFGEQNLICPMKFVQEHKFQERISNNRYSMTPILEKNIGDDLKSIS